MSKLYKQYTENKKNNTDKIYLFKSGIFYLALNEDAQKLSKIFDFKITNLSDKLTKIGFPGGRLEYYTKQLEQQNIEYEIIDSNNKAVENVSEYLNNLKTKEIMDGLMELDMNNVTFKEAFDILLSTNKQLKQIANKTDNN